MICHYAPKSSAMKRIGLFLLVAVVVFCFAGCPGGDNSFYIKFSLNDNCSNVGIVRGRISNVSTGYRTGTISIRAGQTLDIELPEAGTYRFFFETSRYYWDFTRAIVGGEPVGLSCR